LPGPRLELRNLRSQPCTDQPFASCRSCLLSGQPFCRLTQFSRTRRNDHMTSGRKMAPYRDRSVPLSPTRHKDSREVTGRPTTGFSRYLSSIHRGIGIPVHIVPASPLQRVSFCKLKPTLLLVSSFIEAFFSAGRPFFVHAAQRSHDDGVEDDILNPDRSVG
jgi:hypothetical protein